MAALSALLALPLLLLAPQPTGCRASNPRLGLGVGYTGCCSGWQRTATPRPQAKRTRLTARRQADKPRAVDGDPLGLDLSASEDPDPLDEEIAAFAASVLPRAEHKKRKKELLERLRNLVQVAHGSTIRVLGFGSSFNGCGEGGSDIDVSLYIPPHKKSWDKPCFQGLAEVVFKAQEYGLNVMDWRPKAVVPIVTFEMVIEENGKNVSSGYTCDVCWMHVLPQYNTRLLRCYSELMPELAPLVVAVKRWAKVSDISKTFDHFISSYSWTLLVVYYCQVCHDLPSLHAVELDQQGETWQKPTSAYDCRFVEVSAIKQLEPLRRYAKRTIGLGLLLRGFFRFYATPGGFGWEKEVVSVRLGERREVGDVAFSDELTYQVVHKRRRFGVQRQVRPGFPRFSIEDPIEVHRNLNFALREPQLEMIREKLSEAHAGLEAGNSLAQLLQLSEEPPAVPRKGGKSKRKWLSGYLPLGKPAPLKHCVRCGAGPFPCPAATLEHMRDCNQRH